MAYAVGVEGDSVRIELRGSVTIRDAQGLAAEIGGRLRPESAVAVETEAVEDVDTSVLQLLCSVQRTAAAFTVRKPSAAFTQAVDRCALRREFFSAVRENE
jgi:ABC-type transporter Mla MlaB component